MQNKLSQMVTGVLHEFMDQSDSKSVSGERIAKVIARAGLCSRREAEQWIVNGRVSVDGKTLTTPAFLVSGQSKILVDGAPLASPEPPRLWRYHKPVGLVTTTRDPQGRPTIFDRLPEKMPRVHTIGRLDLNTEGLLLLTTDGALKRYLELPDTGWQRRYRVRAFGKPDAQKLASLKKGVEIDGIRYREIEAVFERQQGGNAWLTVSLREGKNREVKRVLEHIGLKVNRLIRLSFGPFQLGNLEVGAVEEVPRRILRQQLGARWAEFAGASLEKEPAEPKRKRNANHRRRS